MFYVFEGLVFSGVLMSVLSFFLLVSLPVFEKEIDILELENSQIQLQNRLQESELLQLSQQIQPHFMFNTLNIVLSLARLNRQKDLVESIEKFSMYLRYKYTDKKDLIPFNEEMAQVKNYLYIQQLRFGKKLDITIQTEEMDMPAGIPPYTLQILVENAFKHALGEKKGQKKLLIIFERLGNWVKLYVIDNGTEPLDLQSSQGIGLENIRKRLKLLFDLYTDISITKNKEQETVVQVVWPYITLED
ncbi:sensor histidine kinase [Sporolactobacillus shoreae]|nr:histidine kinase [Sporolactobacillus shoreae]